MGEIDFVCADVLDWAKTYTGPQFHAMLSDPPAGIGFMGKAFDTDYGGRDVWIKVMEQNFRACFDHLLPGAHAFVWALPRTSHWTATALENAGFEIRDVVTHLFGSGFPKSLDASKAIDKAAGAQRKVIAANKHADRYPNGPGGVGFHGGPGEYSQVGRPQEPLTAAATENAQRWTGYGTALKPASEHWILCRKPFNGTVAENCVKHGTGALNIDGARIGSEPISTHSRGVNGAFPKRPGETTVEESGRTADQRDGLDIESHRIGRWPANFCLTHHPGCECVGKKRVDKPGGHTPWPDYHGPDWQGMKGKHSQISKYDADGKETVVAWDCVPECPVRRLSEQSGSTGASAPVRGTEPSTPMGEHGIYSPQSGRVPGQFYADKGTAERFFFNADWSSEIAERIEAADPARYQAKASRRERDAGCSRNPHPTVKPLALCKWLATLLCPPTQYAPRRIAIPFCGSGTEAIAAMLTGFEEVIAIDNDPEYIEIAKARAAWWREHPEAGKKAAVKKPKEQPAEIKPQGTLL